MRISLKSWDVLYISTFSAVVTVEIKLYWLKICTPHSIYYTQKSYFAELAFPGKFSKLFFLLGIVIIIIRAFCS